MKDLLYYHITYGGVPMTFAGRDRFRRAALTAGHPKEQIEEYLRRCK